jgi:DNA-binding NarL/FixJ family response regulator
MRSRSTPKARVIIAEDHRLLADAYETLLAPDYDVVASVADGRQLLKVVQELRPDVVVLDIAMPLLNGLDAGRLVKEIDPSIATIFVTANEDPALVAEAFRTGAGAYLLKRSAGSELLTAIRDVMKQKRYVTPLVTAGTFPPEIHPRALATPSHQLTTRQREVLQLLAEGKAMKEVASILKLTLRTVAFHKYRMMKRLGIRTNADLIRFAIQNHLV